MELAVLKDLYSKSALKLETAKKMFDEAKDEAAKALATKACEEARAEEKRLGEMLEVELADQKRKAQIAANLRDVEAMTTVQIPAQVQGKAIADKPAETAGAAEPVNHEKAIAQHEELFGSWLAGKQLGDVALNALQPRNSKLVEKAIENGSQNGNAVAIPPRMLAKILRCDMAEVERRLKSIPMTSGDGSSAGGRSYLWWPEYDTQLKALPPEEPSLFMRVTKRPIVGGTYTYTKLDQSVNNFGSVAVSRGTEGSNYNETEIEFSQATIYAYPLNAYTEITKIALQRDRIGCEAELTKNLTLALQDKIDYEIVNGCGSGCSECLGLRQDDDVNLVDRAVASQVCYNDLVDLESAVRVSVRQGATYAIADGVKQYLKKLMVSSDGTTDRRPLFASSNMIAGGIQDRLNEYPWFVGSNMSTIGNNGDVIFGALQHYTLAIEQEAVISRSDHYKFKSGVVAFRLDAMVGGRAIHPGAFAVLVHTSGS